MWSAAILAGGRATRFGGRDKGALVVDGDAIRTRQLAALSQVADDIMIIGGNEAHRQAVARQNSQRGKAGRLHPGAIRVVSDHVPDCGPLGGLHTALIESRGAATAIVACDMPFVSAAFLAHLLTLCAEADVVVPATDRGYHPLCAAYTRACIEPIARRIAAGHLKMTDLLDEVRVRVVTVAEMRAFGDPGTLVANVNTPGEYLGLEALQGHKL
jgi:molybdopterin-guanine dinucleotide biosynthesis protein A